MNIRHCWSHSTHTIVSHHWAPIKTNTPKNNTQSRRRIIRRVVGHTLGPRARGIYANICKPQAILPIKTLPSRHIIVIRPGSKHTLLIIRSNNNNSERKYGADALRMPPPYNNIRIVCIHTGFGGVGTGYGMLKDDRFTEICSRASRGDLRTSPECVVYSVCYVDAMSGRATSDLCSKRLWTRPGKTTPHQEKKQRIKYIGNDKSTEATKTTTIFTS